VDKQETFLSIFSKCRFNHRLKFCFDKEIVLLAFGRNIKSLQNKRKAKEQTKKLN